MRAGLPLNPGADRIKRLEVRSKLFVPGTRPELFAKAAASEADSLSFDLEDAVPLARKDEARQLVRQFLQTGASSSSAVLIVRVNPVATSLFRDDIASVTTCGLHVLNLPKVESSGEILAAVQALEHHERLTGVTEPVGILANIETPKGLRLALDIATAHPRVVGLQLGMLDFARSCGIARGNRMALDTVRLGARFAASEAGIALFDGAFGNVKDPDGFRAEAQDAKQLGLNGKSCIHPSQIAIANDVFSPSIEEIERAKAILIAAETAAAEGVGAFLLDGDMVDAPVIERARGILARGNKATAQ